MNQLNDKIWDNNGKIIPEIRRKLLIISKKITEEISDLVKIKHIYFTGSLATYNWTPTSDIDLHIIVDIVNKQCEKSSEEYFDLVSKVFNNQHNIFIKGYKVEVNVKTFENFLKNKAVYDLAENEWIELPKKSTRDLSDPKVVKAVKHYEIKIENLISSGASSEYAKELKKEIKNLRVSGLQSDDGEYSEGNLIFKVLRNSGYLGKLFTYYNKLEDENLSLESFQFKKYFNTF
jgi:predicted nucleotidyltransferase